MTSRPSAPLLTPSPRLRTWAPSFGAFVTADGVSFRVWAPLARTITLFVRTPHGIETCSPRRSADGIWEATVAAARAGARYAYAIDGGDPRPDPASRFQPDGVHGWSEVVDPSIYEWRDAGWRGIDPQRVVLYELHVGTFSGNGSFTAVAERLPYLKDLGVTAIELMPVADFPGRRNWGYDGVALFAAARVYGRPDDLRALVDRAHAAGLGVILDAVYNHLGPEGAYLPEFSPQFLTDAASTPWGKAVNLNGEGSAVVRRFLIENALHWIHEYHVDGLRLDATHALIDRSEPSFLSELTEAVHTARDPRPLVFAEDHRNLAAMLEDPAQGGWGLDGVWADDFHHIVRRMLAGDSRSYFSDYEGRAEELAATLRRGWLFVGQRSRHHQAPRGTDPSGIPMRKSIVCVQNHDQTGNRPLGDRLHHQTNPAAWRAAVALLLSSPMTPLLFMGQEWAASTPFQFFTDFDPSFGAHVVEGRRREFSEFPEFTNLPETIPSPQADETFAASRLRWEERGRPEHAGVLEMHRALLELRTRHTALQGSNDTTCTADALDESTVLVCRPGIMICARLRESGRVSLGLDRSSGWRLLFTTEDAAYTGDPQPIEIDPELQTIAFSRPGAVILEVDAAADV
jgi:maltooligosyltrehalose trehalohydrolase